MVLRYKEQLGAAMRRRRLELGLSQKDVAEAAHVKEPQTISRWERGISLPSDLEAAAAALKTTIPELMAGIRPPRRVARKLDITPQPDPSQLDRIEEMLTVQGETLAALREALEVEKAEQARRAAAKARRSTPGTPHARDLRRGA